MEEDILQTLLKEYELVTNNVYRELEFLWEGIKFYTTINTGLLSLETFLFLSLHVYLNMKIQVVLLLIGLSIVININAISYLKRTYRAYSWELSIVYALRDKLSLINKNIYPSEFYERHEVLKNKGIDGFIDYIIYERPRNLYKEMRILYIVFILLHLLLGILITMI